MLALQPLHPLILPIIQILGRQTVILLVDIPTPPRLALFASESQFFGFGQLLDFPVVTLVAQGGGGGEEKGAGHHGEDEGEAEEQEGVALHARAVLGREAVPKGEAGGRGGEVFAGGEDGHGWWW